jgi:hypothetical protein
MIGSISNITTVYNSIDKYWSTFACCTEISPGECIDLLLAFIQILVLFLCWHVRTNLKLIFTSQVIYISALVFWPAPKTSDDAQALKTQKVRQLLLFSLYTIFCLAGTSITVLWNSYYPPDSEIWITTDYIWGILSAITTAANWIPQGHFPAHSRSYL